MLPESQFEINTFQGKDVIQLDDILLTEGEQYTHTHATQTHLVLSITVAVRFSWCCVVLIRKSLI